MIVFCFLINPRHKSQHKFPPLDTNLLFNLRQMQMYPRAT